MDVEVRAFTVQDTFTATTMLSKVTKGARVELALALSSKKKVDPTEVGMALFQSMFLETQEEMKSWLADLIGKSKDEFLAMPAMTILDVIEAIAKKEDAKDFFERVSRLVLGKKD